MALKLGRRCGAILAIMMVLSLLLVPAASAAGGVHVVRRGENLTSIARYYGVDVYALARANNIYNLNRIYPGQRLVIPGGSTTPPSTPTYYTVRRGDTLSAIAARYGTTIWQLMQWNNLSNANFIYSGQVLRVSGGGTQPPPRPVPVPTAVPVGNWTATYYNTGDLSGNPVLGRQDANIDFNWGFGSPATSQVFADHFSVRWTRTFNMAGGTYRVSARVDDGVRVYIDGVLVIDSWIVQAVTTYTRDVVIPAGNHTYTVEYFDSEGLAEIHITSQKL